jgi:endoglycosylceramidase
MAFVEPHVIFNGGAPSALGPVGERAGFSFHLYCFERSGLAPCARRRELVVDNAEAISKRNGWPLVLSEFGATDSLGEVTVVGDLADRRMLSWLHWAYWNHDPFAARPHEGLVRQLGTPPEGTNVKEDKLVLLARPYPRAVAGTPLGWTWSPESRTFEARWSTTAAGTPLARGAITEIVLPQVAFPVGWHVAAISGGKPVESGEAGVLAIAAAPGAGEVSVRVEPGRGPAAGRKKAKIKRKAKRKPGAKAKRAKPKRKPSAKAKKAKPKTKAAPSGG